MDDARRGRRRRERRLLQELDIPNIVYKLTRDITGADGDCLIAAADRITLDLQGFSLTGTAVGTAITDNFRPHRDLIVVKNGAISNVDRGIDLNSSRVSIIAVTASHNGSGIFLSGARSLVKSSTASSNISGFWIAAVGDRAQIQQSVSSRTTPPSTTPAGSAATRTSRSSAPAT